MGQIETIVIILLISASITWFAARLHIQYLKRFREGITELTTCRCNINSKMIEVTVLERKGNMCLVIEPPTIIEVPPHVIRKRHYVHITELYPIPEKSNN